jgi:hypothetical protein
MQMADTSPPLQALISLSQTHRSIHEARIKREFTLVITMVTLYTAAIVLRYSAAERLPLDNYIFLVIVSLYLSVLACTAWIYLRRSACANDYNQRVAENAEDEIVKVLSQAGIDVLREVQRPSCEKDSTREERKHPNKYRWRWQVAIILFAAGSAVIAFAVPCISKVAG